eukprot:TRINITY_DN6918_c0_g1_i16.p2 TRINITY_DN6918_c0_g1~~TRINITY_DN6918_c0_g1_i16.p2  ORF type:complete len:212 (+),score=-9.60 TRINITY_DN6918_c0_g1_i16:407-1042(+)
MVLLNHEEINSTDKKQKEVHVIPLHQLLHNNIHLQNHCYFLVQITHNTKNNLYFKHFIQRCSLLIWILSVNLQDLQVQKKGLKQKIQPKKNIQLRGVLALKKLDFRENLKQNATVTVTFNYLQQINLQKDQCVNRSQIINLLGYIQIRANLYARLKKQVLKQNQKNTRSGVEYLHFTKKICQSSDLTESILENGKLIYNKTMFITREILQK